jgi:hypothetical protein
MVGFTASFVVRGSWFVVQRPRFGVLAFERRTSAEGARPPNLERQVH